MSRRNKGKIRTYESFNLNDVTYRYYYFWLKLIALNVFKWENVPDTIDVRFLELTTFERGLSVWFDDIALGNLVLPVNLSGSFDHYGIPKNYYAYANNGYRNYDLDDTNSVLIFNNYLRFPTTTLVDVYARKLYNIDRTIDVNINAQKTPVIVACSEQNKLSMLNTVMKVDGNETFVFVDANYNPTDAIKVFKSDAPYVADKLEALKHSILNDFLSAIGVENSNEDKKERLVANEVQSNYGIVEVDRNIYLNTRQSAVEKINKMFNLDVKVSFNSDVNTIVNQAKSAIGAGEGDDE